MFQDQLLFFVALPRFILVEKGDFEMKIWVLSNFLIFTNFLHIKSFLLFVWGFFHLHFLLLMTEPSS